MDMQKLYVPKIFMGRTGYQIFVDRFFHDEAPITKMQTRTLKDWSDDTPNWKPDDDGEYRNQYFYGGNLKGIIAKLTYFEKMGFNLIYLSPISKTQSSHHYDVENQQEIDPWIGDWQDFENLCRLAHEKDILICVDLVFNHMGAQSKIFQEALNDTKSVYHDWFEWNDSNEPIFWYGFRDMPQCDKLNPNYQEYVYSTCEKYLKEGADGIRLDLGENFPVLFLRKLRQTVKDFNPQALIVSEMWDFATHKQNPQIYGEQVDSVMNYPLADAICRWIRYGNAKHLQYTIQELKNYPSQVQNVLWNFLDSHDVPRAANMLTGKGMNENPYSGRIWDIEAPWRKQNGFDTFNFRKWELETDNLDKDLARKRLMLASLMQYSVKGIPIVYYGTEAGLTGGKDPFCRKPYPWGNEDKLLQEHYQKLGALRKKYAYIFSQGECNYLHLTENVIAYERTSNDEKLVFVLNRTDKEQVNPIFKSDSKSLKEVFVLQNSNVTILKPYGAIAYQTN